MSFLVLAIPKFWSSVQKKNLLSCHFVYICKINSTKVISLYIIMNEDNISFYSSVSMYGACKKGS